MRRPTGKERDTESGNDYFGARYYASSMGRFVSPDPSQLYYADPTNPQSMNLYSYALNNPLRFTDPRGEAYCQWSVNGAGQEDRDDTYTGNAGEDQGAASNGDCDQQGGRWTLEAGDPQTVQNSNGDTGTLPTPSTTIDVNGSQPEVDDDRPGLTAMVQGVAHNTRSLPWLCNTSISLKGRIPGTPIQVGASLDRSGLHGSFGFRLQQNDGQQMGLSTDGSKTTAQLSAPIPDTPFRATVGFGKNRLSTGLSTNLPIMGSTSGLGNNEMSAGASLTFGYLGDATCR